MKTPASLQRIKERLEMPGTRFSDGGAATCTVTLRDFLIVTHAVPAERARPHVPDALPLDTLPGPDGTRLAFVQTTCFFNDNFHWSPLPHGPGLSYHQSTYRILTRRNGRRGAFFLRTYLSTTAALVAQRAIARQVEQANFFVHVAGDPAAKRCDAYTIRAVGERGQTALDVRGLPATAPTPAPFTSWEDMVFFLTQREEGYFEAVGGGLGLLPVEHKAMRPGAAELVAARVSLWTDLGVLLPEDLLRPIAVLIQPAIVFTSYPPRMG